MLDTKTNVLGTTTGILSRTTFRTPLVNTHFYSLSLSSRRTVCLTFRYYKMLLIAVVVHRHMLSTLHRAGTMKVYLLPTRGLERERTAKQFPKKLVVPFRRLMRTICYPRNVIYTFLRYFYTSLRFLSTSTIPIRAIKYITYKQ